MLWLISPWKRYAVLRKGPEAWQGNYDKNLESRKNFKKKIQESNIVFSNWNFFYFLCFFCVHFFSFALLTIIRITKRQRTHINKASNINKVITMRLWQNQDMTTYLIFRKKIQTFLWFCWIILFSATISSQKLTDLICVFSQ